MSEVSIGNLALQKVGASRIVSLSEDKKSARAINACYAHERDMELRRHAWNFSKTRIVLAPSAVAPAFDYGYAFPLPADYLSIWQFPLRPNVDWSFEQHEGSLCVLTNDGTSINLLYVARVEDTTRFDPLFEEALACRIAAQICEEITQSNSKLANVRQDYDMAIKSAKVANAVENLPRTPVEDDWVTARL